MKKKIIITILVVISLLFYFSYKKIKLEKEIKYETDIYTEDAKLEVKKLGTLENAGENHTLVVVDNKKAVFIGEFWSKNIIESFDLITKEHKITKEVPFNLRHNEAFEISKNSVLIFSSYGILEYNIDKNEIITKKNFNFKDSGFASNVLRLNDNSFLFSVSSFHNNPDYYFKYDYIYSYKTNKLELIRKTRYDNLIFPVCHYTQTKEKGIIFALYKVQSAKYGTKYVPYGFQEVINLKNKQIKTVNPDTFTPKYNHSTFLDKEKTILYHKTIDKFLDLTPVYNNYYKPPLCTYNHSFLINDDEMLVICGIWNTTLKSAQTSVYKYNFNEHDDKWTGWFPIYLDEAAYWALSDDSFIINGGTDVPFHHGDIEKYYNIYQINLKSERLERKKNIDTKSPQ